MKKKSSHNIKKSTIERRLIISPGMCGHNSLLVGQFGDWTWDAVHQLCDVNPYQAKNEKGNPSYFSFFYYNIKGSAKTHLKSFTIGDEIDVFTSVYQCGAESLQTIHQVSLVENAKSINKDTKTLYSEKHDENCLYVENFNRWVSRADKNSNEKLVKSTPKGFKYKHLPTLPTKHLPWKYYKPAIEDLTFFCKKDGYKEFITEEEFSTKYDININRDINGVGLLYFASYFNIIDETLLELWELFQGSKASFLNREIIDQQICYLGNADYTTELLIKAGLWQNCSNPHEYVFNIIICREQEDKVIAISTIKVLINEVIHTREIVKKQTLETTIDKIKKVLLATVPIAAKDISADLHFSKLRLNSISVVEFIDNLNLEFELADREDISFNPSTFFEFSNIKNLAVFLNKVLYGISDDLSSVKAEIASTTQEKVTIPEVTSQNDVPIAIVGMSGVFPGAKNCDDLWKNLEQQKQFIKEIPETRWNWRDYFGDPHLEANKTNSKWGGFIDDVDKFDPLFFGISPKEAELMDPQQRIFLETVWKTIENAGYNPLALAGKSVGVFVGVSNVDYLELLKDMQIQAQTAIGSALSVLANRVSYILNICGPSETVDTACSSSLVAIYRAVRSIQNGDSEMAIAGGVNLLLIPSLFISYSKAGMLSPTGKCKTFDKSADGYVRGEGVGAVLLKRLDKAVADKDHIYATIAGGAVNHGGRANSFTAPNPKAQTSLLTSAYKNANIDISTVSYIETHGTGTELGDPVEIKGIKEAFAVSKSDSSLPCGLGAIKTNIGHLESAAGIAGLIKVALAIHYKKLPGNVNFEEQNPYIDFSNTSLYVLQKTKEWNLSDQKSLRRAGVSSFGSGGTNSHIVLEEYLSNKETTQSKNEQQLFVLSARDTDRLYEYAESFYAYLQNTTHFADSIAYTMQTGREHMEAKIAIVASSIDELKSTFKKYLNRQSEIENFYSSGNINFKVDLQQISKHIKKRNLAAVAKCWIEGSDIDWLSLYTSQPQKSPLPCYPFARESYWVSPEDDFKNTKNPSIQKRAMLDENLSTLEQQKFRKTFLGEEFYLADHIIQGNKVLPGVAYLEILRLAGNLSSKREVVQIKDVVWIQPIVVSEKPIPIDINVSLKNSNLECEIKSSNTDTLHCYGNLVYDNIADSIKQFSIEGLQEQMNSRTTKNDIYSVFKKAGLDYGSSFRAIEWIAYNDQECLAKIELPQQNDDDQYFLHPNIMDAAAQPVIRMEIERDLTKRTTFLPFSVEKVDVYSAPSKNCYSYVRVSKNSNARLRKYDIFILDESGNTLVALYDMVARGLNKNSNSLGYYNWEWQKKNKNRMSNLQTTPIVVIGENGYFEKIIKNNDLEFFQVRSGKTFKKDKNIFEVNFDNGEDYRKTFKHFADVEKLKIIYIAETTAEQSLKNMKNLFHLTQVLQQLKISKVCLVCYCDGIKPTWAKMIASFARSVSKENPDYDYKVVEFADNKFAPEILIEELEAKSNVYIRYDKKERWEQQLQPLHFKDSSPSILKNKGVYLITGGAGGLGLIFAQFLAQNYKAKLILIGRSKLNAHKRKQIKELKKISKDITYFSADITDLQETKKVIALGVQKYGKIDGVIHSAGIFKQSLLLQKTEQQFLDTTSVKITGALNLDKSIGRKELDFFAMFSSIASIMGDAGLTDYSAANGFLDGFATWRNQDGKRKGKTISINWPLWQDGGMKVSSSSTSQMKENLGLFPLDKEIGVEAFLQSLNQDYDQTVVLYGDQSKIQKALIPKDVSNKMQQDLPDKSQQSFVDNLQQKTEEHLKKLLSKETKISVERIDEEKSLDTYGIDSVMIVDVTRKLETDVGELSKTLFFEYQNIREFAQYLVKNRRDKLENIFSSGIIVQKNVGIESVANGTSSNITDKVLQQKTEEHLKKLLSKETKIPAERIDEEKSLDTYGIDSVMIVDVTRKLETDVGELSKTLFFEYQNIREFAQYLVKNRRDKLENIFSSGIIVQKNVGIESVANGTSSNITDKVLQQKTEEHLKKLLSKETKIPSERIDEEKSLDTYGIDSVMIVDVTRKLETDVGELSKTLFFEYQNIREFAQYLVKNRRDKLEDIFSTGITVQKNVGIESVAHHTSSDMTDKILQQKTEDHLKKILSKETKIPAERIDEEKSLDTYGIDSVMIVDVTRKLEADVGELSKTLFFEYQNIREFAGYLVKNRRDNLRRMFQIPLEHITPKKQILSSPNIEITPLASPDIAIIGISGRYPKAQNLNEFWENLKLGRDCIEEIPIDRWDYRRHYSLKKAKGKYYCKWGGFLEDIDKFDSLFFNISPREADAMDPQERLFLQTSWHALEDAGYNRKSLKNKKVGVFAGVMFGEYQFLAVEESLRGNDMATYSSYAGIANRVSYFTGITGPSMSIDTACSSSLVTIHMGCESIKKGECELVIAGGVNLSLHPNKYIHMSELNFLSSDGRCRSFGEGGDGYVPGEGVGAVVLKSLEKAEQDGDHIYGVVKGSYVNHGGKTNGFTVPNPNAQAELIKSALETSGVDPKTISYFEAHGTGTPLGDPIEITGMNKGFSGYDVSLESCPTGSVKSVVGHLEAAAGIVGITKILLQMKHKTLVPSLHSQELNKNIDWKNSYFKVQREINEWKRPLIDTGSGAEEIPRRASISSFGATGTNAHLIIEEYVKPQGTALESRISKLVLLSAKNHKTLLNYAQLLSSHVKKENPNLERVAYTLQTGRDYLDNRLAIFAKTNEELLFKLEVFIRSSQTEDYYHTDINSVVENQKEMKNKVEDLLQLKEIDELAKIWVNGVEVDWSKLYLRNSVKRISLPTYPFAKRRHWISDHFNKDVPFPTPALNSNINNKIDTSAFIGNSYIPTWTPISDSSIEVKYNKVFVVYPSWSKEFAAKIIASYSASSVVEIVVDYDNIDEIIQNTSIALEDSVAVYFIAFDDPSRRNLIEDIELSLEANIVSLFKLTKALIKNAIVKSQISLKLVTDGLHKVLAQDKIKPFSASVVGFARVFAKENTQVKVSCVDIKLEDFKNIAVLPQDIFENSTEVVAVRENKKYQQAIYPAKISLSRDTLVRKGGTYLILGGAGGIGGELSFRLAQDFNANLIWIGRRDVNEQILEKISKVEKLGGKALYLTADGTDLLSMQNAVQQAKKTFGDIHGAVHSALVLKDNSIYNMEEADLKEALWPKIFGSFVLHEILKNENLDFMLFFSSVSSFIRYSGQSNYTAGCTFKDAFAGYLNQISAYPVININWGYWGEVGIVANSMYRKSMMLKGWESISTQEGIDFMLGLLSNSVPQAVYLKAKKNVMDEVGIEEDYVIQVCPDHTSNVSAVKKEIKSTSSVSLKNYDKGFAKFNMICKALIQNVLQKLEATSATSGVNSQKELQIHSKQTRLFEALIDIANSEKTSLQIDQEIYRFKSDFPEFEPYLKLALVCFEKYPQILKGEIKATEVLFPSGSMQLVENIYKGDVGSDYFNNIVTQAVLAYIDAASSKLQTGEKIRILEIGAGTGGTSSSVLAAISNRNDSICSYVYSDISRSFINFGQDKFKQYSFVDFRTLDVEKNIDEQGFELGSFDIVIAANVLHATKNMKNTIQNLKCLLKKNGCLIANELMDFVHFYTMTFGLLEGWWLYNDKQIRIKNSPLLNVQNWSILLEENGFNNVEFFGRHNQDSPAYVQNIIIAESDGVNFVKRKSNQQITLEPVKAPLVACSNEKDKWDFVKNRIQKIISKTLRIDTSEFSIDTPFVDVGVDSIQAMEIVSEIDEKFIPGIQVTDIFDYPNIRKMTDYIVGNFNHLIPNSQSNSSTKEKKQETAVVQTSLNTNYTPSNEIVVEKDNDVAIIGMSAKFPGADNIYELWKNLSEGKDSVSSLSGRWGGFISNPEMFDHRFFNISPVEASQTDPQQRLFLQECLHALEDAGYKSENLCGKKCSVFSGFNFNDYQTILNENNIEGAYLLTGNNESVTPARLSYFLDLKGSSISVNSACSSSLVCVHLACESLISGTSEVALAGGAQLLNTTNFYDKAKKVGMLAVDGKCKTFDDTADGFVPSEGVGVVVLKKLQNAIKDGDYIYGVVKASGVNQDGSSNGITAPSALSQSELEVDVYKRANISPDSISYIEAHGTGTKLGDPIEIQALTKAFRQFTDKKQFCAIGSIKTNIGHSLAASGVAGLIKSLLCLKHKKLLPSIHFTKENRHLRLSQTPFYVNTSLRDWKTDGSPRRAAVSAFGFSGTNAHVVVEEYDNYRYTESNYSSNLIVLSAKAECNLKRYAEELVTFLEDADNDSFVSVKNIAYTLQVGRSQLDERLSFVASTKEEVIECLKLYLSTEHSDKIFTGNKTQSKTVFSENESQGFIFDIIKNQNLEKIAWLWSLGTNFDWKLLHDNKKVHVQKIPLPTYSFSEERHWATKFSPKASYKNEIASLEQCLFFKGNWKKQLLEFDDMEALKSETILVFDYDDKLFKYFQDKCQNAILVVEGKNGFRQVDNLIYEIDVNEQDCYKQLFDSLEKVNILPSKIIHLWANKFSQTDLQKQIDVSLYSIFHIVQSLMVRSLQTQILYTSFSSSPVFQAMAAFLKSVSLENGRIIYKTVQLDCAENLCNIITCELLDKNSSQISIKYQEEQRFVHTVDEFIPSDVSSPISIKNKGVYLLTGGMGGLGKIFSEHLAQSHSASLILVGRSSLSTEQQKFITQLNKHSNVVYFQADVSNIEEIQSVVAKSKKLFGKINGVLHCAGVGTTNFIMQKNIKDVEEAIQAKVFGTINIDVATQFEELDFFTMFSSLSAITENLGLSDYAFANSFMDHFSDTRENQRLQGLRKGKTIAINWPLWQERGMKFTKEQEDIFTLTTGLSVISNEIGLAVFHKSFSIPATSFLVAYGDRDKIKDTLSRVNNENNVDSSLKDELPHEKSVVPSSLGNNNEKLLCFVVDDLLQIISTITTDGEIRAEDSFSDYSLDSIAMVEFANKISQKYELSMRQITPATLFTYTSVKKLGEYLVENEAGLLRKAYPQFTTLNSIAKNRDTSSVEVQAQKRVPSVIKPVYREKTNEPIAIIGMSSIMPRSQNLETFWEQLNNGVDLVTEIPNHRLNWMSPKGKPEDFSTRSLKYAGLYEDIDKFDAEFFNISPREAELMDPQQRIFLQLVWKCLENASIRASDFSGSDTSVFAGVTLTDYKEMLQHANVKDEYMITGTTNASMANRVSYFLNLNGRSETIDTACSSSMVAVCHAVESIRSGQSKMAIAGGVNALLNIDSSVLAEKAGMLSKNGRCKTFDKKANGYVRGEGGAVILMKSLSEAEADGDNIHAIIRGVAINHDGKTNSYTAPNPEAQAKVIIAAHENAQIEPWTVGYIEAHGTGTPIGDPIEISALNVAFSHLYKQFSRKPKSHHCGIGTVKTSIGHLEAAAGIAGIVKTILSIQNEKIPGNIHFEELNPYISLEKTPFYIVENTKHWQRSVNPSNKLIPRRAGVSSFGFGGTNAHVVVEEYINKKTTIKNEGDREHIVVLSAKNQKQLKEYAEILVDFVDLNSSVSVEDIAFTLQIGREPMSERLAMVVASKEQLVEKLRKYTTNKSVYTGSVKNNSSGLLVEGREGLEFLKIIFQDRKLSKIAKLWTSGVEFDWKLLYPNKYPNKICLPTYPFAKQRHWIPQKIKQVNKISEIFDKLGE